MKKGGKNIKLYDNIAIIPARSGSKRIPNKNIKDFYGHPIISYIIKETIKTNLFDVVMVSTDSKEYAEISKKYGAEVPFLRSDKASDDNATTTDVVLEVLNKYLELGKKFKNVCCLYPTAVLTSSDLILKIYNEFIIRNVNIAFPIIKYSCPIHKCFKMQKDNTVSYYFKNLDQKRTQDLEVLYHDTGQFYWCNVLNIIKTKKMYSDNNKCIIVDENEFQDIDNPSDWNLALLKYKNLLC